MDIVAYEKDLEFLIRDKCEGDASKVTAEDKERLAAGEPLAYIIGWIPFLGLRIDLSSRPLIPRPETEWWTEQLITHLKERLGDATFSFLDLCAGSGAIGLAVMHALPNARVSFGELMPEHCEQIRKNIALNGLEESHVDVRESNLFESFRDVMGQEMLFSCIAANPPYIPVTRELDTSVAVFEPPEALFAGNDGLVIIDRIATEAARFLGPNGELWMEADISNIETAAALLTKGGAEKTVILNDPYDRPRVVVSYYP